MRSISPLIGTCLNPKSIWVGEVLRHSLLNVMNDMGMMALVFLVRDRFQAINDPIVYKFSQKRPRYCLAVGMVLVTAAIGIDVLGQVLWLQGRLKIIIIRILQCISFQIRAVYMFVCFFM